MASVDEIREAAESNLITFIRLVAPHRVLGRVHEDLCSWLTRDDRKSHQMVLLPRDHQKSSMVAYYVAWEITRNPAITVMYVSSTVNLAEKQAKFIKDVNAKWPISHKYATLRDRLDQMVDAKKLPRDHAETVAGELCAGFDLLRRCRNAAGHPDVLGDVDSDTVFMNLRMFTEYARRVHALIEYFGSTSADW